MWGAGFVSKIIVWLANCLILVKPLVSVIIEVRNVEIYLHFGVLE
jgi:hypothetical protein